MITCIFVFFFLPETHRRSLENLDEMFYAKVSARKFKGKLLALYRPKLDFKPDLFIGYICSGVVHRDEDSKKAADMVEDDPKE
jgi:hypothetical protein